jgi:basic membrane protein A and related proteins
MQVRRWFGLVLVALVALLAACGGDDGGSADDTTAAGGTTAETSAEEPIKVGLVTDIGGLNDRSFNFLASEGLKQAEEELGVEGRILESKSDADYIPNLQQLADGDYDLVIGVGFLITEAIDAAAQEYPDTNFAIVDVPIEALPNKPSNVRGLIFKEQEGGYLAGYLAGLIQDSDMDRLKPELVVSSVGGQKIPPVDRYIAGFMAGAKAANAEVQTLNGYSQDFVDQAKCKEVALDQIRRGSDVIIQVAGGCGLGALDAAAQENVWGIGADADQGFLGDHILASALKKVDVSVYSTIEAVVDGSFTGGENSVFDVKNDGVGIGGFNDAIPAEIVEKVEAAREQIKNGEITDIPETVE